jgi:hypothetical protein
MLAYQNYVMAPAAGVMNGTVADGAIDVRLWRRGDVNGDRAVDFADLVPLAQHYNTTVGPGHYAQGDLDGDGMVTFADLVMLAQQYNAPVPGPGASDAIAGAPASFAADAAVALASVPEPASVMWAVVTMLTLVSRRTRW